MTPEEYLNRARALIPAIRERAPYMEQLRRLPDRNVQGVPGGWTLPGDPAQALWGL